MTAGTGSTSPLPAGLLGFIIISSYSLRFTFIHPPCSRRLLAGGTLHQPGPAQGFSLLIGRVFFSVVVHSKAQSGDWLWQTGLNSIQQKTTIFKARFSLVVLMMLTWKLFSLIFNRQLNYLNNYTSVTFFFSFMRLRALNDDKTHSIDSYLKLYLAIETKSPLRGMKRTIWSSEICLIPLVFMLDYTNCPYWCDKSLLNMSEMITQLENSGFFNVKLQSWL